MVSEVVIAVVLLVALAALAILLRRPPGMSERGRKSFQRGVWLTAISVVLLAAEFVTFVAIKGAEFSLWRSEVFWLAVLGFCVNGVAVFCFIGVLANLLPFTKGDPADVTPVGIILGLGTLFAQLSFSFLILLCSVAP